MTITTTITITIKQFTICFKFKLLFEIFVIFSCLSENRNFNSNLLREQPGKADTRDRHAELFCHFFLHFLLKKKSQVLVHT